ncbi:MAG: flagellar export chaperone FliS [Actinobacteria bacterium]|nr:MAG: flagellar export chaperone FliS [Actinomycetota bacterium]
MNPYASPQAYRESSVLTASPEQLVVMLYDGAGRFLRQAEAALGEGAVEHAHDRMNRGEAIVDELLATLDMDQGQIAERLQAIYVYCKRCLIEARLERDASKVRLVVRLLTELREAWAQVAAGVA